MWTIIRLTKLLSLRKELEHKKHLLKESEILKTAIEEANTRLVKEVHLQNKKITSLQTSAEALIREINKSHFFNPDLTVAVLELQEKLK